MAIITWEGTEEADTYTGVDGDGYRLNGLGGADTLTGADKNDEIKGGGGKDTLDGADGNDKFKGGAGADHISGGNGNDHLDGGRGNDTLLGDAGNDTLKGGIGDDYMDGGAGNDLLLLRGNDTVVVGEGHDTIGIQGVLEPVDGLVTVYGFTNAIATFDFGSFDAVYNEGSNTWTVGGMTIQSGDGNSLAPPAV